MTHNLTLFEKLVENDTAQPSAIGWQKKNSEL